MKETLDDAVARATKTSIEESGKAISEALAIALGGQAEGSGWLIENGRQEWWDGRQAGAKAVFTKDHSEAMRFARFEDAERARCWLLEPIAAHLRSTEHVWMTTPI